MSTDKKESIGFKTPAKTIEEQYEAIFKALESQGKSWSQNKGQLKFFSDALSVLLKKATKVDPLVYDMRLHMFDMLMMCELGEQLNDIAKRLTRLEKKLAPIK